MREMSMLEEMLVDEYFRCERNLKIQQEYLLENEIKGYISTKRISGREYYYLQHREGKRVLSRYIPQSKVSDLVRKLDEQKKWKKSIKNLKRDMKNIERVIGREQIEYIRGSEMNYEGR
ncbi:MAG: hypothetical protein K5897_09375 [Eubacterium sp.]|nr:hypothetical protein [Eubacterium sp.]